MLFNDTVQHNNPNVHVSYGVCRPEGQAPLTNIGHRVRTIFGPNVERC